MINLVKDFLMSLWKKFGKPRIDNPKTPQDESDFLDPVVEAGINALVDLALAEAKKRGFPVSAMDVANQATKRFPGVAKDRIYRLVIKKLSGQ